MWTQYNFFFLLGYSQDNHLPPGQVCFRPDAYNITAVSVVTNNQLSVTLYWNATVRSPSDLPVCNGSRRWRVGYLEYNSAQELESADRGLGDIRWETQPVTAINTNYTFDQLINTSYYVFYVGHRSDKLNNSSPQPYSSMPQLFGQQSEFIY